MVDKLKEAIELLSKAQNPRTDGNRAVMREEAAILALIATAYQLKRLADAIGGEEGDESK